MQKLLQWSDDLPSFTDRRAMRVLAFVSLLVVTTGLSIGAGLLLAVQTPKPDEWVLLGSMALALYVIAPIGLGSLLAFWDPNRSSGSRRAFRRTTWVVAALQAFATVLICAYVAVTGAPWWLVALFTSVAIVLTILAALIGPALRTAEAPAAQPTVSVYTRIELRRDIRRITIAAVIALLAAALGLFAVFAATGEDISLELLGYAPIFALLTSAFVCSLITMRLGRRQRELLDGDLGRLRDIAKVVLRGKPIPLSPEENIAAARFAALSWVTQAYQLASFIFLVISLVAMQIISLTTTSPKPFHGLILAVSSVTFIVLVPLVAVQLHRTRRYAAEHADLV